MSRHAQPRSVAVLLLIGAPRPRSGASRSSRLSRWMSCGWGSEAKVQQKSIRSDIKGIQERIKVAETVEETSLLNTHLRKHEAILSVIESVHDDGLDSEKFRAQFDLVRQRLALEGMTDLRLPPHLMTALHKLKIRETFDTSRWVDEVSTARLMEAGIAEDDVENEQERLLADRLRRMLKAQSSAEVIKVLREFFMPSTTFPFQERIMELCQAMAIVLHQASFRNLDDRKDALHYALGVLVEATSVKSGGKGSLFGSVLASFPRGKKLIEETRVHLEACKVTEEALKPMDTHIQELHRLTQQAITSAALRSGLLHLESLFKLVSCPQSLKIKEFMPSATDENIQQAVCTWLNCMVGLWSDVLEPLFVVFADVNTLTELAACDDWIGQGNALCAASERLKSYLPLYVGNTSSVFWGCAAERFHVPLACQLRKVHQQQGGLVNGESARASQGLQGAFQGVQC